MLQTIGIYRLVVRSTQEVISKQSNEDNFVVIADLVRMKNDHKRKVVHM